VTTAGLTGEGGGREPDPQLNRLTPRVRDEVEYIIDEFALHGIPVGVVAMGDGGIDYMYAKEQILVQDQYLDDVVRILSSPSVDPVKGDPVKGGGSGDPAKGEESDAPVKGEECDPEIEHVIEGVSLLRLTTFGVSAPDAIDRIDGQLGRGKATPDHVLTVANNPGGGNSPGGEAGSCPATEPQVAYYRTEPFPSVNEGKGGTGVRIYIADTGYMPGEAKDNRWLDGVTGEQDPNTPQGNAQIDRIIRPYAGHGTFVAGVVRCMAPAATIHVDNVFAIAGSALESQMVPKLTAALQDGYSVIHLSIAAPTKNDLGLIAFAQWLTLLQLQQGVACIVAAGNNGSKRPCWPAAFPEVTSVGALGDDWHGRARFSNHGDWVDVYAPGRNLVNAYPMGTYVCRVWPYKGEVRRFYGMATWSGTSFSTPIVTGLVAAQISSTGADALTAAAALLTQAAAQTVPGVGPILLPPWPRA
jgi:subtilisin family serine protease